MNLWSPPWDDDYVEEEIWCPFCDANITHQVWKRHREFVAVCLECDNEQAFDEYEPEFDDDYWDYTGPEQDCW